VGTGFNRFVHNPGRRFYNIPLYHVSVGREYTLAVNYFAQKMPEDNPEQFVRELIVSQAGVIQSIGRRFPPSL